MNPILVEKALEKVPNRHVLINMLSCRVRQLNSGSGAESRPLLAAPGTLSAVDTALLEIIEDRLTVELSELLPLRRPMQNGNRPKGWERM